MYEVGSSGPAGRTPLGHCLQVLPRWLPASAGRPVADRDTLGQRGLPRRGAALYTLATSVEGRTDAERQLGHRMAWAAEGGLAVTRTVSEVGSGLNGRRPSWPGCCQARLWAPSSPGTATGWPALAPSTQRPPLPPRAGASSWRTAMNWPTTTVLDMTEVLTSMYARLHGRYNAAGRVQASVAAPGAGVASGTGA